MLLSDLDVFLLMLDIAETAMSCLILQRLPCRARDCHVKPETAMSLVYPFGPLDSCSDCFDFLSSQQMEAEAWIE